LNKDPKLKFHPNYRLAATPPNLFWKRLTVLRTSSLICGLGVNQKISSWRVFGFNLA